MNISTPILVSGMLVSIAPAVVVVSVVAAIAVVMIDNKVIN